MLEQLLHHERHVPLSQIVFRCFESGQGCHQRFVEMLALVVVQIDGRREWFAVQQLGLDEVLVEVVLFQAYQIC